MEHLWCARPSPSIITFNSHNNFWWRCCCLVLFQGRGDWNSEKLRHLPKPHIDSKKQGYDLNPVLSSSKDQALNYSVIQIPLTGGAARTILSRVWLQILFHSGIEEQCLRGGVSRQRSFLGGLLQSKGRQGILSTYPISHAQDSAWFLLYPWNFSTMHMCVNYGKDEAAVIDCETH